MFDILKSKKDLQEQIESHMKQIDALGLELQSAIDAKAEAERMLSETQSELATVRSEADAHKAQIEAQAAQIAEAHQQLEVASNAAIEARDAAEAAQKITDEKIAVEAARLLASSGHPPIKLPKSEVGSNRKTLSKGEFDKLTPAEKSAFSIAGGRIVGD